MVVLGRELFVLQDYVGASQHMGRKQAIVKKLQRHQGTMNTYKINSVVFDDGDKLDNLEEHEHTSSLIHLLIACCFN